MAVKEDTWAFVQEALGYDEQEMARLRQNPKTEKVIARAGVMGRTNLVAEVVEARGCFNGHKTGQKIFLDGAGNLLAERGPSRICIYLMNTLGTLVFGAQELIYSGVDPGELVFNRCACLDVGASCGGWGRVVLELTAEPGSTQSCG